MNWLKAIALTLALCIVILPLVWLFAEVMLVALVAATVLWSIFSLKKYFDRRQRYWRK